MNYNNKLKFIKIGSKVVVKDGHPWAGNVYTVTRVDNHQHPICAGYHRWKPEELFFLMKVDVYV